MAVVLDAGALIAAERGDRGVLDVLREAQRLGIPLVTSSALVAQVWRGGGRQDRLARLLPSIGEVALGPDRSRRIGELLAADGSSDVVDGAVVDIAEDGDQILTADPVDIGRLVATSGRRILVSSV